MSHTEGKLKISQGYIKYVNGGNVAYVGGRDARDARRLVACWNRLAPFSTEQIEQGVDWMQMVKEHEGVMKEHDELQAALRDLYIQVMVEFAYCPDPVKLEAILAKYKEAE